MSNLVSPTHLEQKLLTLKNYAIENLFTISHTIMAPFVGIDTLVATGNGTPAPPNQC